MRQALWFLELSRAIQNIPGTGSKMDHEGWFKKSDLMAQFNGVKALWMWYNKPNNPDVALLALNGLQVWIKFCCYTFIFCYFAESQMGPSNTRWNNLEHFRSSKWLWTDPDSYPSSSVVEQISFHLVMSHGWINDIVSLHEWLDCWM